VSGAEHEPGAPLPGTTDPVEIRTDRVRVDRTLPDVGVAEAHRRFGGLDVPASLVGMLTALALTVLLYGLIGAALGAIGYQTGLKHNGDDLTVAGLVGGIVTLFVAFVVGGWAAARIARYDGARNGLASGVWTILLALILAGLGAWLGDKYDVFANVGLPHWFSRNALTAAAIASGVAAAVAMLVGGLLGGLWGERFHRRADAAIASTRPGGLFVREREVVQR
jgi:hypothetical protein